jgi:hypothetical protein
VFETVQEPSVKHVRNKLVCCLVCWYSCVVCVYILTYVLFVGCPLDFDVFEIAETEDQKDSTKVAVMEDQYNKTFDEMNDKITQLDLEKKAAVVIGVRALEQTDETGAGSPTVVVPGSDKKPNYTPTHPNRHEEVELVTTPKFIELKKLQRKQEDIWWCTKHIETLGVGDKPD